MRRCGGGLVPLGVGVVEEAVGVKSVVVVAAAGDAVGSGGSVHRPSDGVHIGERERERAAKGYVQQRRRGGVADEVIIR